MRTILLTLIPFSTLICAGGVNIRNLRCEYLTNPLGIDVTIPANTTATIILPAKSISDVTESGRQTDKVRGVKFLSYEDSGCIYAVESGNFSFHSIFP